MNNHKPFKITPANDSLKAKELAEFWELFNNKEFADDVLKEILYYGEIRPETKEKYLNLYVRGADNDNE